MSRKICGLTGRQHSMQTADLVPAPGRFRLVIVMRGSFRWRKIMIDWLIFWRRWWCWWALLNHFFYRWAWICLTPRNASALRNHSSSSAQRLLLSEQHRYRIPLYLALLQFAFVHCWHTNTLSESIGLNFCFLSSDLVVCSIHRTLLY